MTVLKPCPFCGKEHPVHRIAPVIDYDGMGHPVMGEYIEHISLEIHDRNSYIPISIWNTRPIEDALRKQLDTTIYEAKLANEAFATIEKQDTELRKQLDIAIEYIKDDLYTDKSYEAVEILKKLEG